MHDPKHLALRYGFFENQYPWLLCYASRSKVCDSVLKGRAINKRRSIAPYGPVQPYSTRNVQRGPSTWDGPGETPVPPTKVGRLNRLPIVALFIQQPWLQTVMRPGWRYGPLTVKALYNVRVVQRQERLCVMLPPLLHHIRSSVLIKSWDGKGARVCTTRITVTFLCGRVHDRGLQVRCASSIGAPTLKPFAHRSRTSQRTLSLYRSALLEYPDRRPHGDRRSQMGNRFLAKVIPDQVNMPNARADSTLARQPRTSVALPRTYQNPGS